MKLVNARGQEIVEPEGPIGSRIFNRSGYGDWMVPDIIDSKSVTDEFDESWERGYIDKNGKTHLGFWPEIFFEVDDDFDWKPWMRNAE